MITFEKSEDYDLIRSILTHPKLYPFLSDDHSPPAAEYQPIRHQAIWYVIVRDEKDGLNEILGLWMFVPANSVCWEVHTALLPCAWGERGQLAGFLLPAWIWEHTICQRIITSVPSYNRLALQFAMKAGMRMFGINPASFLRNGILCDQVMFGLSRPEVPVAFETEGEIKEELCRPSLSSGPQ